MAAARAMGRRKVPAAMMLGALLAAACSKDGDAVLEVTVTALGSPEGVSGLEVTLTSPAVRSDTETYARSDGQPIAFPITLTAILPARAAGDIVIDVRAVDAAKMTVAIGHEGPVPVRAGARKTVYVQLDCGGGACAADGGVGPGDDGGVPMGSPRCGNGHVDPLETCDIAIPRGEPGACPPADCSDRIACTKDIAMGSGCTASCKHEPITAPVPGDGCCPEDKTRADDPDCSADCGDGVVNAGETCDTGIASGPGSCPTESDCKSPDKCWEGKLRSRGTCSAVCAYDQVTDRSKASMDGCCPLGATAAFDGDCPVVCGNGIPEMTEGEKCDVGIPAGMPGACPATCPNEPKKIGFLSGAGCQAACAQFGIFGNVSGDGSCAADANLTHAIDTDCPTACGNGRLEPGEACDPAATGFGACPTSCPPSPSKCLRTVLRGDDPCSAHCETIAISACVSGDGCCPTGCTNNDNDPDEKRDKDCSDTCGDGLLQVTRGEVCDIAIKPGAKPNGSCPTQCISNNPCTEARMMSAGTCAAACVLLPITAPRAGDGCCPNGADFTIDADCAPQCGNGIVESPAERCDYAAGIGSCPTTCPSIDACTPFELRGEAAMCSARCVPMPITGCASGDRCCPKGCTAADDADCAVICGDGVVSDGETCDRGITAGKPGSCPWTCDDGDACTADLAGGSMEACNRTCTHKPVTACLAGDGCCPAGCTPTNDADCATTCGDGRVGTGETCDPPASCPTVCPDDGDPCTVERLIGDPKQCTAACRRTPVTACARDTSDRCCPTGCTALTDSDC